MHKFQSLFVFIILFQSISSVQIRINATEILSFKGTSLNTGLLSESIRSIEILSYEKDEEQIEFIEHFKQLTAVAIIDSGQRQMPVFRFLPNVKNIFIRRHNFDYIKNDTLRAVPVVDLDLSLNNISRIDDLTFGPKVRELTMKCNNLKTFDNRWFQNLSSLAKIDLSGNQITVLKQDSFKAFSFLESIELNFNNMKNIGTGALGNRNHFSWLDISQNKLEVLPSNIFKSGNLSFRRFWLADNELTDLSDELLDRIVNVSYSINIDGNPWKCACFFERIFGRKAITISKHEHPMTKEQFCKYCEQETLSHSYSANFSIDSL